MDFDKMAYPDDFEIAGAVYKGQRDKRKGEVLIPYSEAPTVNVGDTIVQKNGPNVFKLLVTDADYLQESTLGIGTKHPHMLTLTVQNLASEAVKPKQAPTFQIGTLSAQQVQIGDGNVQTITISLAEVVRQVASSKDSEAKGLLRQLLENNTVAAVVGAGATTLLGLL